MKVCESCGKEFDPPRGSKRVTCSDSCKVSLGWANMSGERREQRLAAMSDAATRNRCGTKLNEKRWVRPGERERTAQQNRERWADPDYCARVSAAIRAAHATPAVQQRLSAASRRRWQNPRYRANCLAAMIASHQTQYYRDLISAIRTAQWRDPEYRRRGVAAIRRRAPAHSALMRQRAAERRQKSAVADDGLVSLASLIPVDPLVRPPLTLQMIRPPLRMPGRRS